MATITYNWWNWTYYEVTAADWRIWMDRNLWASRVATSKTDSLAYWDYFQWGRWDDWAQLYNSTTTSTKYTVDNPKSVENPSKFVTQTDWRSVQTDTLWASWINIPTWWAYPTPDEWDALCIAEWITNWATDDKAFASTLKLTKWGIRDYNLASYAQGTIGTYWSNSSFFSNCIYMYFDDSQISPNTWWYRGNWQSIRLIKKWLPTTTTWAASSVSTTSATWNWNITSTWWITNTKRWIVYSTSTHINPWNVAPTNSDYESKVEETGSFWTWAFTESLTSLISRQIYYVRAYSYNSAWYCYWDEVNFTTLWFTNPTNAYTSDWNYATCAAISWVVWISLSKDWWVNYTSILTKTFTNTEEYLTYWNWIIELWGTSWTWDDIDDTSFRLKISHNWITQVYKNFWFSWLSWKILTWIEVWVEAKYTSNTIYVDNIHIKVYYWTSVIPVLAGAQAYASDWRKAWEWAGAWTWVLVFYDGADDWCSVIDGLEVQA